ncbi:MAG: phage tail sheath subtilisin-like domain-containing protein, partial [Thermoplasmata archaeon]|nr:phage tail sheath subtilisin-like domain-containing protein [Thermoplasmata archaeon]
VASFFEQGGQRAWVVRIVHEYGPGPENMEAISSGILAGVLTSWGGEIRLAAQNEGTWGDGLQASLTFQVRPISFESATTEGLILGDDAWLPQGSLLRLTFDAGPRDFRFVSGSWLEPRPDRPGRRLLALLDAPCAVPPVAAEAIEATLDVQDTDTKYERRELFARLGLSASHPRWMATVLCHESTLVHPDPAWIDDDVRPADPTLPGATTGPFAGGLDRSDAIVPEDFFDAEWVSGDDTPASGIQSLMGVDDVASVVAADLYSPAALMPAESILDVSLAGPTFETCADPGPIQEQGPPAKDLAGLRLDPGLPSELAEIVGYQTRLVDFAEGEQLVALLDVPPGLHQREILAWRSQFSSSYAAAYHPWLKVARPDDDRDSLIAVNPSSVAAGIVARREITFGVPYGPANELAYSVVDVTDGVSPARHDELHPQGVNVFLREREGVRLTAARTLSSDAAYRQLSVRRLMTMLARVLERETQWLVFEPNDASLRANVRHLLTGYLRQLYAAGAFRGATQSEAFFVRCDESNNPPQLVDAGQLIVEVGVAPAEPIEFLVLQLVRDGDGTLHVEARRG